MTNLKNLLLVGGLAGSLSLLNSGDVYSQISEITEYETFKLYNDRGQFIEKSIKNNFEYNNKGEIVMEKYIKKGTDCKEEYILTLLYKYDNEENIIEQKQIIDTNGDCKDDYLESWLYKYDEKGDLLKVKYIEDKNADGLIDEVRE